MSLARFWYIHLVGIHLKFKIKTHFILPICKWICGILRGCKSWINKKCWRSDSRFNICCSSCCIVFGGRHNTQTKEKSENYAHEHDSISKHALNSIKIFIYQLYIQYQIRLFVYKISCCQTPKFFCVSKHTYEYMNDVTRSIASL